MLDETPSDTQQIERLDVEAVNKAGVRQPLYAARKKVFPKRASGNFRRFKWLVMLVTLTIYYVTPWIRWDRGPFAPDQAVLVDLANRRFYFFFVEIWPQEFYYVAGMLVMAGVGLFLVTSTVGRAWCGYTCPQTVWVDLFLVVERAVEGDRNARIKLDKAPWTLSKIGKRVSKHFIWILIGIATGGAWIFYFADAPSLMSDVVTLQAAPIAYFTIATLTATTYTFGGMMREQVCTYMCPWPRIQGAMLDENSLTVTYNDWRGEPRSRHAKKAAASGQQVGDCVDCNACVAVCPMGIDIRDGQQLECITCALCIDACDDVMTRLGRERGLISYATLADYTANTNAVKINGGLARDSRTGQLIDNLRHTDWRSIIRPRTVVYFLVWAGIGIAMLVTLAMRTPLGINVIHDRNPLYVQLQDGQVRNGYEVKVLNMLPVEREAVLTLEGLPGATMWLAGADGMPETSLSLSLEPDKVLPVRIFIKTSPAGLTATETTFRIHVDAIDSSIHAVSEARFQGPEVSE